MVRTTHSTRKLRSIWSNPVISWNGSTVMVSFSGEKFIHWTCSLLLWILLSWNSFIERVLFFYDLWILSSANYLEHKLYASNASPENSSPKKALHKDRSMFNSKNWSCYRRKGSEKWSWTTIHQEVHGPIGSEWWSQHKSLPSSSSAVRHPEALRGRDIHSTVGLPGSSRLTFAGCHHRIDYIARGCPTPTCIVCRAKAWLEVHPYP